MTDLDGLQKVGTNLVDILVPLAPYYVLNMLIRKEYNIRVRRSYVVEQFIWSIIALDFQILEEFDYSNVEKFFEQLQSQLDKREKAAKEAKVILFFVFS